MTKAEINRLNILLDGWESIAEDMHDLLSDIDMGNAEDKALHAEAMESLAYAIGLMRDAR